MPLVNPVNTPSSARYTSASGQTFSLGASTIISYPTVDYDALSQVSGGVFTAKVAGLYQVNAAVCIANQGSGASRIIFQLEKNGSIVTREVFLQIGANQSYAIGDQIRVAVGDTIRVVVNNDASSGTPALANEAQRNYFALARIGP